MNSTDFSPFFDNSTTSPVNTTGPSDFQRIFVGSFYFFLALPSFALHVLVFLSVLKTQGKFLQFTPFYILLTNHYLADVLKTLFYLLYACPSIWTQSQIYGQVLGDVLGELESVDYCAVLFSTFFMSANRALAIGAPELNEKLFTRKTAVICNVLTWLGGAGVSVANRLLSCWTVLVESKFGFQTLCVQKPAASPGSIIIYIFAYGVVVFYLFALYALAKQKKQMGNVVVEKNIQGYQIRLFLQALGIWMGVVGNAIAFRIIPLFPAGLGTVVATGMVIIGQSYITPISMLIFVKDTRGGIRQLFRPDSVTGASKSWTGHSQGKRGSKSQVI